MLTDFNFQVMHKEWPTGLRDTRSTDAAVIAVHYKITKWFCGSVLKYSASSAVTKKICYHNGSLPEAQHEFFISTQPKKISVSYIVTDQRKNKLTSFSNSPSSHNNVKESRYYFVERESQYMSKRLMSVIKLNVQ